MAFEKLRLATNQALRTNEVTLTGYDRLSSMQAQIIREETTALIGTIRQMLLARYAACGITEHTGELRKMIENVVIRVTPSAILVFMEPGHPAKDYKKAAALNYGWKGKNIHAGIQRVVIRRSHGKDKAKFQAGVVNKGYDFFHLNTAEITAIAAQFNARVQDRISAVMPEARAA